ncbi:MAG: glycosyltransferase [Saprospiraceae bacterium]|nr:glycosyltransferase [Saprospiraceae bacterium]
MIYPLIVILLFKFTRHFKRNQSNEDFLPFVSCIIAVYNEQDVIKAKIDSILRSEYPSDKLKIFIGSDGSTDDSNLIIKDLADKYDQVFANCFQLRSGKTSVINKMTKWVLDQNPSSPDHIIVYTDANIILSPDTITQLVSPFNDLGVAIVDSRIIQRAGHQYGIAKTEKLYMNIESEIKRKEGELWGLSMGAFGGCYALRSNYSCELPNGLLVDDFYISMQAMMNKGLSITNHKAICFENIPDSLKEEFNRKRRIAAGNFQNLQAFIPKINLMPIKLAFVFISHKVLRWLFPFHLLLFILFSALLGFLGKPIYSIIVMLFIGVWALLPLLDHLLDKWSIKISWLRSWSYFVWMNIAVLFGFYRYLRGIHQSTWQPPKRTQEDGKF